MPSRRVTLRSLLLGSLAVVTTPAVYVVARFARPPLRPGPTTTEVGPLESIPTNDWRYIRVGDRRVMIGRRGSDLVALDLRCPHAGCSVEWRHAENEFACPCHGARFDDAGNVLQGPARSGLRRLKTVIVNGIASVTSAT